MKNTQNITICLLVVSAAVLTAMLACIYVNTTREADAHVSIKGGQYIMTTGTWSGSYDLVYITDRVSGRMNAYQYSRAAGKLLVLDGTDLNAVFAKARGPAGGR